MKSWHPRSLVGQMALLIGIALLLAQLTGLAFVLVERQHFNRAEIDTPAITRFTSTAADFLQAAPDYRALVLSDASRRGARYEIAGAPSVGTKFPRRSDTEKRLKAALATAGISVGDVRAALESKARDPAGQHPRRGGVLLLAAQLADHRWINARLSVPAPPPLLTPELSVGTLLIYVFVLSATILIAQRLARPLRDLTQAAEAFRGRNEPVAVRASGPSDLRNAILAFNAMNERVLGLLDEKDRMLGAIGHDLRTPLASLRIRAESVEPADERDSMIRTVEEMTATLEDILTLARSGRVRERVENTDVTALAGSITEQYRELGQDVSFAADGPNLLDIQPILLRRALRNLIDNALKYAGSAEIAVNAEGAGVAMSVLDRGPGMPPEEMEAATAAFYRGEPSRNRDTGGAGLGLSIAKAIANGHGGELRLANRAGGGLSATILLPRIA